MAISSHVRPRAEAAHSWAEQFEQARLANPYLAGFKGVSANADLAAQVQFEGRIPSGLRGTLFRNGPALHELSGLRYRHWFDGDGMVHALRLMDTGLHHTGRLVMTEKLAAEIKAGRRRRLTFGTAIADAEPPRGPDSLNAANTSVLPMEGEVLALWEAGSAYRMDGLTLDTLGPKSWRPDLAGLPFSAHPKVEKRGTIWNFGLNSINSRMVLYEISPTGTLARAAAIAVPDMTMVHDFVVTARHLIFVLPPFRFNLAKMGEGVSFLECHEWLAGAPLRALVVQKSDLTVRWIFELPAGFVFHFGNGWEDSAGVVRFDFVRSADASAMTRSFKDIMRGVITSSAPAEIALVRLDLATGRSEQTIVPGSVEFPRVDPRLVADRYRNLYVAAASGRKAGGFGFNAVRRFDITNGKTDEFDYGENYMVEEHVFVPDRTASGDGAGWAIGTALDIGTARTVLSIFDGLNLAAGPIARAALPYALPLGFHGAFAPA